MTNQNQINIFSHYNEENSKKLNNLIKDSYYYENDIITNFFGEIISEGLYHNIDIFGFFYGPGGGNPNLYYVSKNKQDLINFLSQIFDDFDQNDILKGD